MPRISGRSCGVDVQTGKRHPPRHEAWSQTRYSLYARPIDPCERRIGGRPASKLAPAPARRADTVSTARGITAARAESTHARHAPHAPRSAHTERTARARLSSARRARIFAACPRVPRTRTPHTRPRTAIFAILTPQPPRTVHATGSPQRSARARARLCVRACVVEAPISRARSTSPGARSSLSLRALVAPRAPSRPVAPPPRAVDPRGERGAASRIATQRHTAPHSATDRHSS